MNGQSAERRRFRRRLWAVVLCGTAGTTWVGCGLSATPPSTANAGVTGDPNTAEPDPPTNDPESTTADTEPPTPESEPGTENEYCASVEDWDQGWTALEEEVLELVNNRRSGSVVCGGFGTFDPVGALVMNDALRCAARNHSRDMVDRGFFGHTNPDDEGPQERIERAGYDWRGWGENIAGGFPNPESVVEGWMNSPGHCANIMNGGFTEIGVGLYGGSVWTQVFGTPSGQ